MDSLTQLVLGASVGEAVAGKKLGNKAMLWGALAGTIPDLDVVSGMWLNDMESLAVHRGFTHSIFFAILAPLIMAVFARWYYQKNFHDQAWYERLWQVLWISLGAILILGSGALLLWSFHWLTAILFLSASALGLRWIRDAVIQNMGDFEEISLMKWYLLFLLGFSTHIAIDVFTTYGTQILQPFSDMRLSTNSVSVVDPFYTIPLLLALIVASLYKGRLRSTWNTIGLVVSTAYFVFTFYNKVQVNMAFAAGLEGVEDKVERTLTNPTILNNFLWHGIAETDSYFLEGYYSIFDEKPVFQNLRSIPKNHKLLNETDCKDSRTLDILTWFSDDYYCLSKDEHRIYYHDLRFGGVGFDYEESGAPPTPFYYHLEAGCHPRQKRTAASENMAALFRQLVERIKGK